MKYDIFISYSRKDIEKVRPIIDELEAREYKIWLDLSNIDYGDTFPDRIAEALDASDSLLFMCTPNSLAAPYCKKEIGYARSNGKKIRAILVDGIMPKQGWFALDYQDINCINFTKNEQKDKFFEDIELIYQPEKAEERKRKIALAKEAAKRKVQEEEQRKIEAAAQKAAEEAKKKIEQENQVRIRQEEYQKALAEARRKEEAEKRRQEEAQRRAEITRKEEKKRIEDELCRKGSTSKQNTRRYSVTIEEQRRNNSQKRIIENIFHSVKETNILKRFSSFVRDSVESLDKKFNNTQIEPISETYRVCGGCVLMLPGFIIVLCGLSLLFCGFYSLYEIVCGNGQGLDTIFLFCISIPSIVAPLSWLIPRKSLSAISSAISFCLCLIAKHFHNLIIDDVENGNLHLMRGLMGDNYEENVYQLSGTGIGIYVLMSISGLVLLGTLVCSDYDWKNAQRL